MEDYLKRFVASKLAPILSGVGLVQSARTNTLTPNQVIQSIPQFVPNNTVKQLNAVKQVAAPVANTFIQGVNSFNKIGQSKFNPGILLASQIPGLQNGPTTQPTAQDFLNVGKAGLAGTGAAVAPGMGVAMGAFGGALQAGSNVISKRPIGENVLRSTGEGLNSGLMAAPVAAATNPFLSKLVAPLGGRIAPRVGSGIANAVQGAAISTSQGNPLTPQGVALDLLTGAVGGKSQFGTTSNLFGRSKEYELNAAEAVQFEKILRNKKDYTPQQYDEAVKGAYNLADRHLPADIKDKLVGKPLQIIKAVQKELDKPKPQVYPTVNRLVDETSQPIPTQGQQIATNIPELTQTEAVAPLSSQSSALPTPQEAEQILQQQRSKLGPSPEVAQTGAAGANPLSRSISDNLAAARNKADVLYTKMLDRFHPLSQIAKQADKSQEMQNALTGYYGTGSIAKYHTDFELSPILKSANPDDLRSYLIAQRDAELAGRGIKGSNTGNPQEVISALKSKYNGNIQPIEQAANRLYQYQSSLVKKYLVDTGVVAPKAYEAMLKDNKSYVPFRRVMDEVDNFLGAAPQKKNPGSVASQGVIKGIKGSDRGIFDPLESVIENTYKIVGLGKRQEVAKTIVSLKNQLPEGVIQKIEGPVGNKPNIALFENGKVQHYAVPQEVADAAKGMTADAMSTVVKILSAPTRVFRATATGINPEFMVPNVVRDLQSAFVNVGLNPLKWASGLSHMLKKDELYQEFLKSGGMTAQVSLDRPFLKETVADLTSNNGFTIKRPSDLYKILETMGAYSEQPTRIAAFESAKNAAVKQGISVEEALKRGAYAAQEGTVNFARRGSDTQSLNAIYAFMNARAQGTDRLLRSLKADPKGAGTRLAMIALAPAMALYAWNRGYQGYNDPRVVSESDKKNNFIIMLSDQPIPSLGGAQFIKIPKGDVGKLANIPESFMRFLDGKGGDVAKTLGDVLSAFSPVQNFGDAIPTAIRPIAENQANYSYFSGQKIVPDSKVNLPAQYQSSSYTAPTYKAIGNAAANIGLDVSPAKLQNLVEGYGTGIAKITTTATDKLVPSEFKSAQNIQGQDINRTPVLRRFLGGEKRTIDEQAAIDEAKQNALDSKVRDIQSAINRGDIPVEQGAKVINQISPSSNANPSVLQEKKNIYQLKKQVQGTTSQAVTSGNIAVYSDANGAVHVVNPQAHDATINAPLSKSPVIADVQMTKKISALSSKINDIVTLTELGKMTQEDAVAQISKLMELRKALTSIRSSIKVKAPRVAKLKAKKVRVPKPKKIKFKTIRLKK